MFGISFEHILILGIILLFVGPRRLPELGNTLGKAIRNFKDAMGGVEEANFRKIDEMNQQVRDQHAQNPAQTAHVDIEPLTTEPLPTEQPKKDDSHGTG